MSTKADLAVYIGRFQPFHLGHAHAIEQGLKLAHKVLVLIGTTGGPRTIKNPWTFDERWEMIYSSYPDAIRADSLGRVGDISTAQLLDHPHSDTEWLAQVHEIVHRRFPDARKIILIGHDKDASSFYLKMFPQWKFVDTGFEALNGGGEFAIDATQIRDFLFKSKPQYLRGLVAPVVYEQLVDTTKKDFWPELVKEKNFIDSYRDSWKSAPFPPIFVTTDAVVVGAGHVLLIKRGQNPGKGLWALPGGFLDQVEGIEQCAIRELVEETNIKLQPEVLERLICAVKVFDRRGGVSSEDRGRIITHAHLIKLDDTRELPKVKGADDAAEAMWVPITEVKRSNMFSDHYFILQSMLGYL